MKFLHLLFPAGHFVVSLLFLLASFFLLRREFGDLSAGIATIATATSAGWLAYSGLGLTDIPLAVCFSMAVWIALPLVCGSDRVRLRLALIGVAIGLGALAKGLVPIALAVPFAWFLRRHWQHWWIAIATCLVSAGPQCGTAAAMSWFRVLAMCWNVRQCAPPASSLSTWIAPIRVVAGCAGAEYVS